MKNKYYEKGYIAFTSLLIISAVTLAISTSVTLMTLTEAQGAFTFTQGLEASKFAEGCAEEALLRLRNTTTYTGGNLTIEDASCTISVSGSGPFTIIVTATENSIPTHTKKLQVTAVRGGNSVNVTGWQFIE